MSDILEFSGVTKRYHVREGFFSGRSKTLTAVDDVSLSVGQGETLGLVGESGCGKSTLARLAVRLEPPSAGAVLMEGRDIWETPGMAERMPGLAQMIFQDPFSSLNPRRTIGWTVGEGLLAQGIGDRRERRERVQAALAQVGLRPEHAGRYPHQFSGGQRQRVAIARSLALSPKIIVCDEPVSALDVSIQAQVINLLRDLREKLGVSYLFISHDLAVVGHISRRTAVMYLGRLMELAPTGEIMNAPRHPYTKALLAAAPVPDPERKALRIVLGGDTPSPFAPPAGCPFHPRCPEAEAACSVEIPDWLEVSPGHFARCRKTL